MACPSLESPGSSKSTVKSWARNLSVDQAVEIARKVKKHGKDDPRRVIHSLKVGLALMLISLFYYFRPGFGDEAMWAVLTVVVVFEFSVGATLGKGVNRMLATLLGGTLGVGAHHIATLGRETGEPIIVAFLVFFVAAVVSFLKFFPSLKARYDYGLTIFLLTFSLVSVSGYKDHQVIDMARKRLLTIIIGSATAIVICICICPVWIGEDLHNLIVGNIEKLGNFLQGFGDEYFHIPGNGQSTNSEKSFLEEYRSVLTTKSSEENMANLARWEPRHGQFSFHHPWKHYIKVGFLTRQCAYKIKALNGYMNSEIQTPIEIRRKIQEPCTKICTESGKALKELAAAMKKRIRSSSFSAHITNSKNAAENLKSLLKRYEWQDHDGDLLDIVPGAAVALVLIDVVKCIDDIAETVVELSSVARFKTEDATVVALEQPPSLLHRAIVQPQLGSEGSEHSVKLMDLLQKAC
ncbi:Aluminum-activated malate transporter 2 [Morus notabilis]|uniref:Aluminum-activated malate transporter 2 n=1 Tax=Morus notabilis TaxID=981085 RepID=W9SDG7_9ROSA|nr:aluminum-activated malate transporter 2 [Morus notabilis]EXC36054.1 Aluminum-activated malate transporter 2 [Morus notabilis]